MIRSKEQDLKTDEGPLKKLESLLGPGREEKHTHFCRMCQLFRTERKR
jgi:hypothetical protein